MADYAWPNFPLTRFQMRVQPLTKVFSSPYSNQVQVADMLAECWVVSMDLAPDVSPTQGAAIEAFLDRLKGAANRVLIPNLRFPSPQGTATGSPTLSSSVAQFANTVSVTWTPFAAVLAGTMLGMGAGGQLVRVMAPAAADAYGNVTLEVAPRIRAPLAAGTAVIYQSPTAPFRLMSANPAVDWHPGQFLAPALEFREDF
jgi:hypothetical protein